MVEQIAQVIPDGHLGRVHEVYVEGPVRVNVLETILTRLPEIAGTVAHCRGAKTLLPEVLCVGGCKVRLTAVDEDPVDRREDVLGRFVTVPSRIARVVGQEHA